MTKRPLVAERVTGRALEVPGPTRSVVVVRGDRFAWAVVTKRPDRALLLTDRLLAMSASNLRQQDLRLLFSGPL